MEPTTAFAVVQTGLSVAKMFGPQGVSPLKLHLIQMEMLKTISSQIGEVQKGINLILRDLEGLRELLISLPKQVVDQLYNARAEGLIASFAQEVTAYRRHLDVATPQEAADLFLKRIEREVLEPVREVRNVILRNADPVLIPIVSMLLQTDVQAMICCDYPRAIFLTQLEAYERWLEELVGPSDEAASVVQRRIASLKEVQARLHADVPKLSFDTMCFARRWSEKHRTGRSQQYWVAERAAVNVFRVTYTEQIAIQTEQIGDVDRLLNEHPGDGIRLLDRSHLPYVLIHNDNAKQVTVSAGRGVINGSFSSDPQVIAHSQVKHVLASLAACNTDSNKHQDAARVSEELQKTGLALISHAALLCAGRAALTAVVRFKKAVEA